MMLRSLRRLALASLSLTWMACPGIQILADRANGHVAAEEATVIGLCQTATPGLYQKCKVHLLVGDVMVAQELWLKWMQMAPPQVPATPADATSL
jgi:hypothetical protein